MVVTAVVFTEIVHISRHWKGDLVSYGISIQTSPRFMYLLPLKPDHSSVCLVYSASLQHPICIQNSVTIKPCIKIDHMSNQKKAEFVNNNFGMQSFWGGHGKISSKS
jgi:hypothetical protein